MKTIIVPTDFSPAAENAARYAVEFASHTKSDITLLNAIKLPSEVSIATQAAFQPEDYPSLKRDTGHELKILANRLLLRNEEQENVEARYRPNISYSCQVGDVADMVKSAATNHDINLIIMGLWDTSSINRFFSGSTSHEMIEKTNLPLMLIPFNARFKPIKTIAFATDLSQTDINIICSLATMARIFNAELLLVHVLEKNDEHKAANFLSTVTNQANYPNIYYRGIIANDVDASLHLLLEHREVEMLVMVHRKRRLFDRLFNHSHTQNMARHLSLPLLIFPAEGSAVAF